MPVATFPIPDTHFPNTEDGQEKHLRQLANVVRGIMDGKINSSINFSLGVSPEVVTTVTDERIRDTSRIILVPENDAAASHLYSGTVRITAVSSGSFQVTHLPHPLNRNYRVSFLS